jgi:hypothetical protein
MNFRDYKSNLLAEKYITFIEGEYFPDYLEAAQVLYTEIIDYFEQIVESSDSSANLLRTIMNESNPKRTQLLRIFRKYISPDTSVEMLKTKKNTEKIINNFGFKFRGIDLVKDRLKTRDITDKALIATLYEYNDRGQKGYDLTELFFTWFENKFSDSLKIIGPKRAGKDVNLMDHLPNFLLKTPADFLIFDKSNQPIAVGFARYDTDRGGAQEDDRIKGNRDNATELMNYCKDNSPLKIIYLNDGPGLLLGSMWDDYSSLEEYGVFDSLKVVHFL